MDSDFQPANAVPALIGLLLYYLALKIWWGLPGPDWGYLNYVDTIMVNLMRAFLYTLPTIVIFFYCRHQRAKQRRELRLWRQEIEKKERGLSHEIREDFEKIKNEFRELQKIVEVKLEPTSQTLITTEVIQGFNIQEFV